MIQEFPTQHLLRPWAVLAASLLGALLLPANALASEEDPLEWINRPIYEANMVVDRTVLRPLAKSYQAVAPEPVEQGVSNFVANLYDFNSAFNAILQGDFAAAARNSSRFLINSTLGVLGLIDLASRMEIERERYDFGQTLARWGVGEGPFVMMPILGPRTLRGGVGVVVDGFASVPVYVVDDLPPRFALWTLDIVDTRAKLLGTDNLLSGDRYIFMRDAYLQQRRKQLGVEQEGDDFADFEDEWGEDL